ncbi:MAG TPA: DUF502 domain-containing protein [Pirellulaceae bacterium]|jgi:uncharacterized membrane protein|nr:DUF502 domain-containing protein [Pirellulaceae bacterium]
MRERLVRSYGFLRTTLLGGVLFLLPLIVVGILLGQVGQVVLVVVGAIGEFMPYQTRLGYAILFAAALGIVIGGCFTAGLIARHSIGRWLSEQTERNLTLLYPRYAIYKDQIIGNIGGDVAEGRLRPVKVAFVDCMRLGLEVERSAEGLVTVYLPSSPDPWSGTVALVASDRVERIEVPYVEMMTSFEKLGADSLRIAGRVAASKPSGPSAT